MGRLALNKMATAKLKENNVEFVQLLWDKESSKVGIRPCERVKGSYNVTYGDNGNGAGFSCVTFLNFLTYDWTETRNFPLEWEDDHTMYVFHIPEEHIGKPVPVGHMTRNGSLQRKSRIKTQEELALKNQEATEVTP